LPWGQLFDALTQCDLATAQQSFSAQRMNSNSPLPYVSERLLFAVLGAGEPCSHCNLEIAAGAKATKAEVEIQGTRVTWRFHPHCYQAWSDIEPEQHSAGTPHDHRVE
jgi:hypothetical protein